MKNRQLVGGSDRVEFKVASGETKKIEKKKIQNNRFFD